MMNVQKFIAEKGWKALEEELAITVKEYDCGLRVLNYNQIESVKNHPVSNECRGLKLDSDGNIVSRSFSRFFNYGECDTVESFKFDDVTVFEKADGSLCMLYWCPQTNRWEISTRGMAFAEGNHVFSLATEGTFRDWILKAMGLIEDAYQSFMEIMEKKYTVVTEYIGPENRIVTKYSEAMLVLLAIIDNQTGEEVSQKDLELWKEVFEFRGMKVRLPKTYNLTSAEECLQAVQELPSTEEGYVVRHNVTGQRVKIKSPGYVALHRLRGNGAPTFNNLAELVLLNEHEEYLTVFSDEQHLFDPIVKARDEMIEQMTLAYDEFKDIELQKDFAMKVKDLPFSGVLFKARKEKCSVQHSFAQATMNQQVDLLRNFMSHAIP